MFSQSAAEDFDGSYCAGSERPVGDCGAQPAPIDVATRVGTMVMIDDSATRSPPFGACGRAFQLLSTYDDARMRAPRTLENVRRLSRTRSMAWFHSTSRDVGSSSARGNRRTLRRKRSTGAFGTQRISAPRGIETNPRAIETPHAAADMSDLERRSTDENDEDLNSDFCNDNQRR